MNKYNLDLYVEDLFFSPAGKLSPIDSHQWQIFFSTWLNHLDLDLSPNKYYEICLIFTDDQEIQRLNHQFRHQNKPTDVLAFASLETDFPEVEEMDSTTLGDVIISVETASLQAQNKGHSLEMELIWLASHGFLHLLGWDHPDDDSLMDMLTTQQLLFRAIALEPLPIYDELNPEKS